MALRPAVGWQVPGAVHSAGKPMLFAHASKLSASALPTRHGLHVARQPVRPFRQPTRVAMAEDFAAFKTLGVSESADAKEIQKRYELLLKRHEFDDEKLREVKEAMRLIQSKNEGAATLEESEEDDKAVMDPAEKQVIDFYKKLSVVDWARLIWVTVESFVTGSVKNVGLLLRQSWRMFKSPWSLPSRLHATMAVFYYTVGIAVAWYEPSQIGGTAWLLSWGLIGFMYQKDEVGFKRQDSPYVPKFRANAFNAPNLAGFAIIRMIWVFSGNLAKQIVTEIGPDAPEALFDILRCTFTGAISIWPALFISTQRMFPGKQGYNWRSKENAQEAIITPGRLQPGCKVKINGLKAAKDLNGQIATLGKWDSARGRWQVRTADGKMKAMKPQFLFPEVESDESAAEKTGDSGFVLR